MRPIWPLLTTPGRGDKQVQPARFPPTQTSVGDKVQEPQDKSPWASSCAHCSVLVVLSTVERKSTCYQAEEGGCSPAALATLILNARKPKGTVQPSPICQGGAVSRPSREAAASADRQQHMGVPALVPLLSPGDWWMKQFGGKN